MLVTGGAGFIGSHLTDSLLNQGAHIWVFDNLSTGTLQNIEHWRSNANLTFLEGDLLDPVNLAKIEETRFERVARANPKARNPDSTAQKP